MCSLYMLINDEAKDHVELSCFEEKSVFLSVSDEEIYINQIDDRIN